jgi:hypothetical protein
MYVIQDIRNSFLSSVLLFGTDRNVTVTQEQTTDGTVTVTQEQTTDGTVTVTQEQTTDETVTFTREMYTDSARLYKDAAITRSK